MKPESSKLDAWPATARRLHPPGATVAMLLVAGLGVVGGPVRLDIQLAVLGIAVALFAPPQLARDSRTVRARSEVHTGTILVASLFGAAALTLAAWLLVPMATLALVLATVAVHVGRDAARAHGRRGDPLVAVAFGGLPLVLPAAFHPGDVGTTLTWITLNPNPGDWSTVLHRLGPPLAIAWFALAGLTAGRFLRRSGSLPAIGELVAGAILCATAPPLIALTWYLVTTSGIRGVLRLAIDLAPNDGRAALPATFPRLAPLVGAALTLGIFGLVVALLSGLEPGAALAVVPVWGLGTLALAHHVLETFALPKGRRKRNGFLGRLPLLARIKDSLRSSRRRGAHDRAKP